MPPMPRVRYYVKADGTGAVSIFKMGEFNHIVQYIAPGKGARELLCLGIEHAEFVYKKCKEELDQDDIKN